MKPRNETNQPVDEFELIELGSVSEETKGGAKEDTENLTNTFHSRQ